MADEEVRLRLRVLFDEAGVGRARRSFQAIQEDARGLGRSTAQGAQQGSTALGQAGRAADDLRTKVTGTGQAAAKLGQDTEAAGRRGQAGLGVAAKGADDLRGRVGQVEGAARGLAQSTEDAGRRGQSGLGAAARSADDLRGRTGTAAEVARGLGAAQEDAGRRGQRSLGESARAADETRRGLTGVRGAIVELGAAFAGVQLARELLEAGRAAREFEDFVSGAASGVGVEMSRVSEIARSFRFVPPEIAAQGLRDLGQIQAGYGKTGEEALNAAKAQLDVAEAASVVMGLPVAQIVEGIASAYRGEFDSLQRIIPSINAARIEQEALAVAQKDGRFAATELDKAVAVQTLVMQEGARYVQQLGANTGTAAAKQREAQAAWSNARIELGNALLPLLQFGSKVITGFSHGLESLPGPLQAGVLGLTGLAAAALIVGPRVQELIELYDRLRTGLAASRAAKEAEAAASLANAAAQQTEAGATAAAAASQGRFAASGGLAATAARALGPALAGLGVAFAAKAALDALAPSADKTAKALAEGAPTAAEFEKALHDLNNPSLFEAIITNLDRLFKAEDFSALTPQIEKHRTEAVELFRQLAEQSPAAAQSVVASYAQQGAAIGEFQGILDAEIQKRAQVGASQGEVANKTAQATQAIREQRAAGGDLAATQDALIGKYEGLNKNLDRFRSLLDATLGPYLNAEAAAIRVQESIDKMSESLRSNGGTMDISTEKGRANATARLDLVRAISDEVNALSQVGLVADEDRARRDVLIARLQQLQREFPALSGTIQGYIDKVRAIPVETTTTTNVVDQPGKAQLEGVRGAAQAIPPQTNTATAVSHSQTAVEALGNVARAVFGIPTEHHTTATANGGQARAEAGATKGSVDLIPALHHTQITADASQAKGETRSLIGALGDLFAAATRAIPGGGIVAKLFGRQHGGPVAAGGVYVVGEEGPEIFVPDTAGHIYTMQQYQREQQRADLATALAPVGTGAGGPTYDQDFHIYAPPGTDTPTLAAMVGREQVWRSRR